MRRALRRVGVSVVALGGVAVLAPSVASGKSDTLRNPRCGATIYASVTLHSDMYCPGNNGIVIGRGHITVDLNGFTLSGDGSNLYDGIYNPGYDRVTIKDGAIADFGDAGIDDENADGTAIQHVVSVGSFYGLYMYADANGLVVSSQFGTKASPNVLGAELMYSRGIAVSFSAANWSEGVGFYDVESHDTLVGDEFDHNGADGVYVYKPLVVGGSDYLIEYSTAAHNDGDGFDVEGNTPPASYQAEIIDNRAENNAAWGFYAQDKAAGRGNRAENNRSGGCFQVPC